MHEGTIEFCPPPVLHTSSVSLDVWVGVPPQLVLPQVSKVAIGSPEAQLYLVELTLLVMHVPTGTHETVLRFCVVMGHVAGGANEVTTSPPRGPGEGNIPGIQVVLINVPLWGVHTPKF